MDGPAGATPDPQAAFYLILTGILAGSVLAGIRGASALSDRSAAEPIAFDAGRGPFYDQADEPPKRLPKGSTVRHPLLEAVRRDWVRGGGWFPIAEAGWKSRMAALRGFTREGAEAVPTLVAGCDDENPHVRDMAVQVLVIIGDSSHAPLFDAMLGGDPDGEVRVYAAYSRGMVGGMKAGPLTEWMLKMDRLFAFRLHLQFALDRGPDPLPDEVRRAYADYDLSRMDTARVGRPAPEFSPRTLGGEAGQTGGFPGETRGGPGIYLWVNLKVPPLASGTVVPSGGRDAGRGVGRAGGGVSRAVPDEIPSGEGRFRRRRPDPPGAVRPGPDCGGELRGCLPDGRHDRVGRPDVGVSD